jgi:hypothetical protein
MPRLDSATLPSGARLDASPVLRIEILAHVTLGLASAIFLIAARDMSPTRALATEALLTLVLAANAWAARGPRSHRPLLALTDTTVTAALASRITFGLREVLPYSLDAALRAKVQDPALGPAIMRHGISETVGVLLQLLRVAPVRDGRSESQAETTRQER